MKVEFLDEQFGVGGDETAVAVLKVTLKGTENVLCVNVRPKVQNVFSSNIVLV